MVTHARCGVCIGDDGGVGGEYENQNVARFDACWVVTIFFNPLVPMAKVE